MTVMEANAGKPAFAPVGVLETKCSTSSSIVRSNVAYNLNRDIPRLHELPDYGKSKGDTPLAIVGGGPSLNKTWDELSQIENVAVCGSAHDHVIEHGITPRYSILCDADRSEADFIKLLDNRCTYLVASMCDPSVFDALEGYNVVMWHSFQGDLEMFGDETRHAIMGGCTVTLRAINIGIMLGWRNQHFFGLDSSFAETEYAYKGNPVSDTLITVRAGEKEFQSTPAWLAQATHFGEMCRTMGHFFTPTVHGDGLIAAMIHTKEKDAA